MEDLETTGGNETPIANDPAAGDFISQFYGFLTASADARTPELLRKWAAIATLAGALERRVWVETGPYTTFCNLYTLFVAPMGTGKGVIETVRNMWTETKDPTSRAPSFKVAPDSMTKAAMVDRLAKSSQSKLMPDGRTLKYHSLLLPVEEWSIFLPKHDPEIIGTLNGLYGNKENHSEERRFGVQELSIEKPQLNILGGVQPALMATYPEDTWSTGLARRVIMVYTPERIVVDPFSLPSQNPETKLSMLKKLGEFSVLYGKITWETEASDKLRKWILSGEKPLPTHSKLLGYNTNRSQHIIKLAGISAISRKQIAPTSIDLIDLERAFGWLFEAESVMPDIFRAMMGKNDYAIVEELYHFAVALYERGKRAPIEGSKLYKFVSERTTSDKVARIVDLAKRTNMLVHENEIKDLWRPKGKAHHGLE